MIFLRPVVSWNLHDIYNLGIFNNLVRVKNFNKHQFEAETSSTSQCQRSEVLAEADATADPLLNTGKGEEHKDYDQIH